jgi:hypothetical protein
MEELLKLINHQNIEIAGRETDLVAQVDDREV